MEMQKEELVSQSVSTKKHQKGVTMIEYALIAVVVAIVAIAGFKFLGNQLNIKINAIGQAILNNG